MNAAKEITIETKDGAISLTAFSIVGGLAVHPTYAGRKRGYSVTQEITGLAACQNVSRPKAYAVRKALLAIPGADWTSPDILKDERIKREAIETVRLIGF